VHLDDSAGIQRFLEGILLQLMRQTASLRYAHHKLAAPAKEGMVKVVEAVVDRDVLFRHQHCFEGEVLQSDPMRTTFGKALKTWL